MVPTAANFEAHSSEVSPPAENNAIAGLAATAASKPMTLSVFPLKGISFPTDRSEATSNNSVIGSLRSAKTSNITFPTIPVAPTRAIFILINFHQK